MKKEYLMCEIKYRSGYDVQLRPISYSHDTMEDAERAVMMAISQDKEKVYTIIPIYKEDD